MAGEGDDEIQELYDGLVRQVGARIADLLMKRVMMMEDRDWATSDDVSGLTSAVMRRFEQMAARFEQVDVRLGAVEVSVEGLRGRLDEGLRRMDERIDARREADDYRFETLGARIDSGFDRIRGDLRGELIAAVTTQTRTLLLALVGSFAVYGGTTLALVR